MDSPNNTLKQSNISYFFKSRGDKSLFSSDHPSSPSRHRDGVSSPTGHLCDMASLPPADVSVTYHRRTPKPAKNSNEETNVDTRILYKEDVIVKDETPIKNASNQEPLKPRLAVAQSKHAVVSETSRKQVYIEKKPGQKRVLGQYFLELGQPDFFLSNCTVCGLKYSRGDDEDEKVHKSFHRKHLQGVQFKGWQNERIVNTFDGDNRIILVLNSDPSHYQLKVQEVVAIMEKEMGLTNEWLLHRFCKVYLFISCKKIVGCLVSEPIRYGFRVIPDVSLSNSKAQHCNIVCSTPKETSHDLDDDTLTTISASSNISYTINQKKKDTEDHGKRRKHSCTVLQFGNVKFEREAVEDTHLNRVSSSNENGPSRAIVCSQIPEPAVCGVKGVWVSKPERRKGIATKLLDTMRKTFSLGYVLEPWQCAFSQPTSDGKAFGANYCKRDSFLIYKSTAHGN